MPYRGLDQFIAQSNANVTKVYDFPGDSYDDPVLVPRELADEIFQWLEKRSNSLNETRDHQQLQQRKEDNFKKIFLAP
ncbi:hypothetical protein SS50377_27375 [Spironucleus salmonicida]|uniref:Uncharacterized protein n=1 Tax=Spironucleus salmonicida TaxID=348837 RepID=V6LGA3_9EUKA|nr:hypothetical protein SS50377_27375 [Spironucleus salmonicida]|eukprot:EST43323.1 Hypothetical protein SS50377_17000 [Spironucleus salmonicida]